MSRLGHLAVVRDPVVDLETRRRLKNESLKTKKEIAAYWSVHVRTVERWIEKGMPVAERTWAGHPRLLLSECIEWHRSFHQ